MRAKTLILFTLNYPYGNGEEFIENEIKEASKAFSNVIVIPNSKSGRIRSVPSNVEIINWDNLKQQEESPGLVEFGKLFLQELFLQKNEVLARIRSIRVFWGYYKDQLNRSISIKNLLKKLYGANTSPILLYDFWYTNNALAITLTKKMYPDTKYIACAHSYDLYDFRWKCPIPFRGLSMKKIDIVFPDSKYGIEYLKAKVPRSLHYKIRLAYMGTPDFGLSPIPKGEKVMFLSTSSCVSHKRVDWIIRAIENLKDINFEWVHFGDGPEFEKLQKKAKKSLPINSFKFYGWVDFDKLIAFYKENPIDVFVHMSTAEGLPVSLMIASSFGVPIVAIDSMGVPELVNSKTGILLPSNAEIRDVSLAIKKILGKMSGSENLRMGAREFCMDNFSTDNYKEFYIEKLDF